MAPPDPMERLPAASGTRHYFLINLRRIVEVSKIHNLTSFDLF